MILTTFIRRMFWPAVVIAGLCILAGIDHCRTDWSETERVRGVVLSLLIREWTTGSFLVGATVRTEAGRVVNAQVTGLPLIHGSRVTLQPGRSPWLKCEVFRVVQIEDSNERREGRRSTLRLQRSCERLYTSHDK